jgi:hypothetical protein
VSRSDHVGEAASDRTVTLRLRGFTWDSVEQEAAREGVTREELIAFSILYYLADVDSHRISRRISRSPYPGMLHNRSNP